MGRPSPQPAQRQPAVQPAGRGRLSSALSWLAGESVALFAMSGAALTVMAEFTRSAIPAAPSIAGLLQSWQRFTHMLWRPPLSLTGIDPHPDIVAGLNVIAFMTLLGFGARLSGRLSGRPLAPLTWRFFDEDSWLSLIVFQAICLAFIAGQSIGPDTEKIEIFGSVEFGRYIFPLLATLGYFLGDFIGHRAFHIRLYRLAGLLAMLIGANYALLQWPHA